MLIRLLREEECVELKFSGHHHQDFDDGGAKEFYSQRLDINHNFSDNLRMLVFGYAVQQDFEFITIIINRKQSE